MFPPVVYLLSFWSSFGWIHFWRKIYHREKKVVGGRICNFQSLRIYLQRSEFDFFSSHKDTLHKNQIFERLLSLDFTPDLNWNLVVRPIAKVLDQCTGHAMLQIRQKIGYFCYTCSGNVIFHFLSWAEFTMIYVVLWGMIYSDFWSLFPADVTSQAYRYSIDVPMANVQMSSALKFHQFRPLFLGHGMLFLQSQIIIISPVLQV